jgi:hypothetical protein
LIWKSPAEIAASVSVNRFGVVPRMTTELGAGMAIFQCNDSAAGAGRERTTKAAAPPRIQ